MDEIKKKCYYCGNSGGKLSYCSRCRMIKYCNKECQIKDWTNHKKTCKLNERIGMYIKMKYIYSNFKTYKKLIRLRKEKRNL